LGNSPAARLSILIPLIGYFIVFNDAFSHSSFAKLVAELEGKTPEDLGVSISPRLFQMYFGLCFVAFASALYACICPAVVKRHSSAGHYVAAEGDHLGEFAVRGMEIALAQSNSEFDRFRKGIQDRISMDYSIQEAGQEVKVSTLALHYDTENQRYQFPRLLVFLLYGIGFIILLVPAAKVFWKVSIVLYRLVAEHGFSAVW
jgi:hypothetical protein